MVWKSIKETSCGYTFIISFIFVLKSIKVFAVNGWMWDLANSSEWSLLFPRKLGAFYSNMLIHLEVYPLTKVYYEILNVFTTIVNDVEFIVFVVNRVLALIILEPAQGMFATHWLFFFCDLTDFFVISPFWCLSSVTDG